MLTLDTPIITLPTVGKTTAARLKKLKLETAWDLIFYYPFRYDDLGRVVRVEQLEPGQSAVIKAKIDLLENRRAHRRRMFITEAMVADESGAIKIIWFNQPFLKTSLKPGSIYYFAGKVEYDKYGLEMVNPTYELVKEEQTHTARLVPAYPLTLGLTQKQLRFLVKTCLPLVKQMKDFLPLEIKNKLKLPSLAWALGQIHFPQNHLSLFKAQHRLKFDELFFIQLDSQLVKLSLQKLKAPAIKFKEKATKQFIASLPFKLTDDQRKATWQILLDLEKDQPMNRLLEGDVGSGKTVVAAIAGYNANLNGWQTIYMAPTEILAQQHFQTIVKLFEKKKIKVALLTAGDKRTSLPADGGKEAKKKEILELIKTGQIDFIIGTHALIQQGVEFKKVGLVIVDEQHRFGVAQRQALKQKGDLTQPLASGWVTPHLLSMTATPIPRSLALTIYGDLDLSIIKQMPKGRKKILTRLVPFDKRDAAYGFINQQIEKGRQVFVICPLIDPSDKLGVKSVKLEFEKLDKEVFPHLKIGLLHGRMKAKEKEEIMQEFLANK
ncbi:MAG: ATP-dependent DNA helicase RecG, partial [bacterium]